jgi:hypothetical protein
MQAGCTAIFRDATNSPVYLLEELKTKVDEKKEHSEECNKKVKIRSENTQQHINCPRLRRERNNLGSKVGPY